MNEKSVEMTHHIFVNIQHFTQAMGDSIFKLD